MKGTFFKLANADFTGQNLVNLNTIVAAAQARYAFDFRNGNLDDVTGKTSALVPYRVNNTNNTRTQDATVISSALSGLGVKITSGCLTTSVAFEAIKIDGSKPFSILMVGGWSGETVTSASFAGLIDIGSGLQQDYGASMIYHNGNGGVIGARVKSSATANVGAVVSPTNKVCFMILTFDGTTWTVTNKTTGVVSTKTNSELGIVADLPPVSNLGSNRVGNFVYFGHSHTHSLLDALPVNLCQVAYWNKVLSSTEIDAQYAISKTMFGNLI
ncbi:hypothetical protein NCZ17_00885 [Acinetobacter modestus]|uniref:hypothetical protein n=1 Tax=Acinetobacter modestus TaxID=1776740 RepID=UPI00202E4CA9|nr:hypothetical protein [Acinetobacter modestus]MCM1957926.1 hypothetical protein [Acinetobacter modestus]